MVRGVERDPGQITAVVNPNRCNVSTRMEAQTVLVLRKSMGIKLLGGNKSIYSASQFSEIHL
jgi:hypothetical protein